MPFLLRERLGLAVRDNIYILMGWKELKGLQRLEEEERCFGRDAKLVWVLTSQSGFLTPSASKHLSLSPPVSPPRNAHSLESLLYSCLPVQAYISPWSGSSLSRHLTMITHFSKPTTNILILHLVWPPPTLSIGWPCDLKEATECRGSATRGNAIKGSAF